MSSAAFRALTQRDGNPRNSNRDTQRDRYDPDMRILICRGHGVAHGRALELLDNAYRGWPSTS